MNRAVNRPRKNFTVRYATNTPQGFRVDKVPTKTTSCSLFRSQRLEEEPEKNMCHTDLYAYIKVFGNENQRERLVNLKSKVRRIHLLELYREVRGRGGGGGGGGGGGFPGGGGGGNNNNNNNNNYNNKNNNPAYFTSNSYIFSRDTYTLSKDPNYIDKLSNLLPVLKPADRKKLLFQLRRFLAAREEYGTSPDLDAVFTPSFPPSATRNMLKHYLRPVL